MEKLETKVSAEKVSKASKMLRRRRAARWALITVDTKLALVSLQRRERLTTRLPDRIPIIPKSITAGCSFFQSHLFSAKYLKLLKSLGYK